MYFIFNHFTKCMYFIFNYILYIIYLCSILSRTKVPVARLLQAQVLKKFENRRVWIQRNLYFYIFFIFHLIFFILLYIFHFILYFSFYLIFFSWESEKEGVWQEQEVRLCCEQAGTGSGGGWNAKKEILKKSNSTCSQGITLKRKFFNLKNDF